MAMEGIRRQGLGEEVGRVILPGYPLDGDGTEFLEMLSNQMPAYVNVFGAIMGSRALSE